MQLITSALNQLTTCSLPSTKKPCSHTMSCQLIAVFMPCSRNPDVILICLQLTCHRWFCSYVHVTDVFGHSFMLQVSVFCLSSRPCTKHCALSIVTSCLIVPSLIASKVLCGSASNAGCACVTSISTCSWNRMLPSAGFAYVRSLRWSLTLVRLAFHLKLLPGIILDPFKHRMKCSTMMRVLPNLVPRFPTALSVALQLTGVSVGGPSSHMTIRAYITIRAHVTSHIQKETRIRCLVRLMILLVCQRVSKMMVSISLCDFFLSCSV